MPCRFEIHLARWLSAYVTRQYEMEFKDFLINAKIAGYATGGEGNEIKLPDGGKKFQYHEQEFEYADIYYGFNPFSGQEVVRKNNEVFWIMNYYGIVNNDFEDVVSIYQFLKTALQQPDPNLPVRGPDKLAREDLIYFNTSTGNIRCFSGQERIHFHHESVYKLFYHGGLIKSV